MSKKDEVLLLIRNKISICERFTALTKWFEESLKECNWYIYSEAPKGVIERYDRYLRDREEDIKEFRGMHFSIQELTYGDSKRAYANHREDAVQKSNIILNDNNETIESLAWLLLHEFGHLYMKQAWGWDHKKNPLCLIRYLNKINQKNVESRYEKDYWTMYLGNDDVHEERPEELFCNMIATAIVDKQLCRFWWRKNCYKKEH